MRRLLVTLSILAAACGSSTARPTISFFTAAPPSVFPGQTTQLLFGATAGAKLTIDPGAIDVTGRTSLTVAPGADTTYTLTASNGGGSASKSVAVSVSGSGGQAFAVTQLVNAVAGTEVRFRIVALDSAGAVNTNYRGTVQVATDDTQGVAPAELMFGAADGGQVTAGAIFKTAGQRTFVVVDKTVPSAFGLLRVSVSPAPASRLVASGAPATVVAGQPIEVGLTTFDPYANIATGFTGTVHFAATDPHAQLPPDSTFIPADSGSATYPIVLTTAGVSTVTASSTGLDPASFAVTVTHGPASQVTLQGLPSQVAVDTLVNVTVTVRDAFGNAVTDYAGTLHFADTDAQASALPDLTFTAADLGVKVVSVQFGTTGTQTLSAADLVTPSIAGSASTVVLHGPAAALVLGGIPAATVAGTPLTVSVTAVDRHGNVASDFTGSVHFASTDLNAALPADYLFLATDLGTRSFPVVLTSAATSSIIVSTVGLPAASQSVIVSHGPAAQVAMSGLPSQVAVDATQNVTLKIRDAYGNPVTDYAGTLHFTNTDPQASAIPDTRFDPLLNAGTASVPVTFRTAGNQTLSARDTALATLSGAITTQVLHGPAALVLLTGIPASTIAGTTLNATITITDTHGNVATDFTGTVHFASTDPNAALTRDVSLVLTDQGTKTFTVVPNNAGTTGITASSAGLTSATATVVVSHAAAAAVSLTGLPANVTVDVSQGITAKVRDRFGNLITDYAGTLHFTNTDPQASAIADTKFLATDLGVKVVTVQFGTAGAQTLTAADTVTPAVSGSVSTVVAHGPTARLAVSGIPATTVAGTQLPVTITAVDAHGNLASDFAGTVHFASSDASAQLPADFTFTAANAGTHTFPVALIAAGTSTITVTSAPLAATTVSVAVTHAAAAAVTLAGLPPQVVVDAVQNLTVTVRDAFGNPVTDYAGTLHFTNTDTRAPAVADVPFSPANLGVKIVGVQFATAGTQTLTATDTLTPSITGSASTLVLHGPAARLLLAGLPASTVAGTLLVATVSAVDSHGNVVTDFGGTVHFASSDARAQLPVDYVFTAADAGSRTFPVVLATAATSTVTVSSGALASASATVAVRHAGAAVVTLEGLPPTLQVDASQPVTVTVRDAFGNPVTDYTGTLHFTNTDPLATAVPDTTFLAADLGVRLISVQFATAGTQTLSASDTVNPSISGSASTLVVHGSAVSLRLSGVPSPTVAGSIFTATVSAIDVHGNVATDFLGTVHFSSTDATAQLPADYTFVAADLGARTFPIALNRAATTGLTVSAAGLASATASVVVVHAAAALVTLQGLPAQVVVDTVQSVTLTVRDAFANVVTDYAGTLHFTNSDAQATAIPDTTFLAANLGVRTVTVQFATAGTQTLTATDTVKPQVTGSASTQVLHGPVGRLLLTGVPPTTVAGALLTATVAAVDAHGNLVTDFTGTVHFSSTDASATLPPDTAFTAADNGARSFSVSLTTAGARSLTVSQPGGTAAAATATTTVVNAPASRIALTAHAAQVAVDTNAVFTAVVRDRFGNPALDYTGTVHFSSTDPGATAIANVTFTAALFATTDVTLQFATAGAQSLLAADTVNPAISGSAAITVTNGPAAAYALSPLPTVAVAGEPLSLTITAVDAHGNTALNYAGSAAVTSTDPSDRLPPSGAFVAGVRTVSLAFVTAGPHHATVSEVAGTLRADTTTVNIVSSAVATLAIADGSTTAGVSTPATVVAKDAFGNLVASYTGTITLTSGDPKAILPAPYQFTAADAGQHTFAVTFRTSGSFSLVATDAANAVSGRGTFTVAPAAAASCSLIVVAKAGSDVALRLGILDPFANLATGYRGTMSFSSSDAAAQLPAPATYTAADAGSRDLSAVLPTPGDQTIRATDSAAAFTCQVIVSIVNGPFFAVSFSGTEAWAGTARVATVQAQDASGLPLTTYAGTILFSSSDTAASFPANAVVAAGAGGRATVNVTFNTLGLQTFTATDSLDATRTGTAFQLVHGLVYTNPATGGNVRLIVNPAASSGSVTQLDLVSNTTLFPSGLSDPLNGRLLPSTVRGGVFAAGMNLPLDATKVGPDAQLFVQAQPASAILGLGATPQAVGAAIANGILYSGASQKRLDLSLTCTAPCTNDHLRGDVQVRPFPGATSVYYSLRLRLTPGAAPGTVFDGQALATNPRFRAAARDRSGSDVFSGTADFAIGKLEVR